MSKCKLFISSFYTYLSHSCQQLIGAGFTGFGSYLIHLGNKYNFDASFLPASGLPRENPLICNFSIFVSSYSSSSSSSSFSSVNPLSPYQNKPRHSRWRCARTPSDRFSLAVNSYGRSWGSSWADTERRHTMRVYTCVRAS